MENKKLHKSAVNKKIAGVCGGLGEYFNIDPTIIRIIWALAVLAKGAGLLLYIVCAIILPEDGGNQPQEYNHSQNSDFSSANRKVVDVDAEEKR